jgi:polygalacturonase
LALAIALLVSVSAVAALAAPENGDDPYWDQTRYDSIEAAVMANVPKVLDADGKYIYQTVDGTFEYSVSILDSKFNGHLKASNEEYYVARSGYTNQAVRADQMVVDYTDVFAAAIADVKAQGGGTVVVPRGSFVTGAIRITGDNIRLHMDDGAEIKFIRSKTYEFYPQVKTRFEGMDLMGFSPLIYAYQVNNIAVTGSGNGNGDTRSILNGQADRYNWLPWKTSGTSFWDGTSTNTIPMQQGNNAAYRTVQWSDGTAMTARDHLIKMVEEWAPIEERNYADLNPGTTDPILRPANTLRPSFIEPYGCKNVLIADFNLINSPMWEIHPLLSENILVKGTDINSHLGNNDGCNPESSTNVIIEDNVFNTGDDCIAIKSGRNNDGYTAWNRPTTGIIVRNNEMRDGHGAVTAGSEMSGGIQYVFAHNNIFNSANLAQGLRIKTNSVRGGYLKDVYMKDSVIRQIGTAPIHCTFYYEENDAGTRIPKVENIYVSNYNTAPGVTSINASQFLYARQYGYCPVENVNVKDCNFNGFRNAPVTNNTALNEVICGQDINFENVTINGAPYVVPEQSVEIVDVLVDDVSITDASQLVGITGSHAVYAIVRSEAANFAGTIIGTTRAAYQAYLSVGSGLGSAVSLNGNGVVTDLGDGLYRVRVSANANLGTATRLEVVVRNALYTEDQDFTYFSLRPAVAGLSLRGEWLTVQFDRAINTARAGRVILSGGASAVDPVWNEEGTRLTYALEGITSGEIYNVSVGDFADGSGKVMRTYDTALAAASMDDVKAAWAAFDRAVAAAAAYRNPDLYTEVSWAAFAQAQAAAGALSPYAGQSEILAATAALDDAMTGLTLKNAQSSEEFPTAVASFTGPENGVVGLASDYTLSLAHVKNLATVRVDFTYNEDVLRLDRLEVHNGFEIMEQQGNTVVFYNKEGLTGDDAQRLLTFHFTAKGSGKADVKITRLEAASYRSDQSGADDVDIDTAGIGEISTDVKDPDRYDFNGDGRVTLADLAAAQLWYMRTVDDDDWNDVKAADLDGNGVINVNDLIKILAYVQAL